MIVKNHASAPIIKKILNPTRKAKREACQDFLHSEKGGVPDRVESFGEVDSSKNRPRTRLGFVKPIYNGLSKDQN